MGSLKDLLDHIFRVFTNLELRVVEAFLKLINFLCIKYVGDVRFTALLLRSQPSSLVDSTNAVI